MYKQIAFEAEGYTHLRQRPLIHKEWEWLPDRNTNACSTNITKVLVDNTTSQ